jgi:hypothetical protein
VADAMRHGRSHEGVPDGAPIIEVTVRVFARSGAADPSWPPDGGRFTGAIIDWSYPLHLHERALTRRAAVRHAISVLLDDLEGSTTVDAD